jgi:hypothetical protein
MMIRGWKPVNLRRVRDAFVEFERLLSGHRKIELVHERMFNCETVSPEAWAKLSEVLEIEPVNVASPETHRCYGNWPLSGA